jgi:hypothetical protein
MREGIVVKPQITLSLVFTEAEVDFIVPVIRNAYKTVCEQYKSTYGDQALFFS